MCLIAVGEKPVQRPLHFGIKTMLRPSTTFLTLMFFSLCGCVSDNIHWEPPAEASLSGTRHEDRILSVESIRVIQTEGSGANKVVHKTWVGVLEKVDLGKEGAHLPAYFVKNTEYRVVGIIHDNGETFRYGPAGEIISVGRWAHSIAPSTVRSEDFAHSIRNILAIDGTLEFSPFTIPE